MFYSHDTLRHGLQYRKVKKLAKKLDPNSAAARRRAAMKTGGRADAQQQRTLSPVRSHSLGADGGADQPQSLGTPQSFGKVAERGVSPSSHYRNSKSEPRRESMRRAQSGTEVQSQFGFLSERTVPRRKHRQGSATSGTSQHAINDAQFDALFDGSFRAFSSSNNPFVVSGDSK